MKNWNYATMPFVVLLLAFLTAGCEKEGDSLSQQPHKENVLPRQTTFESPAINTVDKREIEIPKGKTTPTEAEVERVIESDTRVNVIEINGDEFTINGTIINLPVAGTELFTLLGLPTRSLRYPNNTIHVWDRLGLFCYEKTKNGSVFEFDIALAPSNAWTEPYDFWPINPYAGRIAIDGTAITSRSTMVQVNQTKKGKLFVQHLPYLPFVWELKHDSCTISILNANEDKNAELGELSIYAEDK